MMYLTDIKPIAVIKKLYYYKLLGQTSLFSSLLVTQLLGLIFSFNGVGSSGGSYGHMNFSYNITYYTGNMVIVFTFIWAFINGYRINSATTRDSDFTFVTNRYTSNVATVACLLTAAVMAGTLAMLSGFLLKAIFYFYSNEAMVTSSFSYVSIPQLVTGIIATILYVALFASLGYLCGAIIERYLIFVVLLPVLFVGTLLIEARLNGQGPFATLAKSIISEASLFLFSLKIIAVIVVFLFTAIVLTNKLEVRR